MGNYNLEILDVMANFRGHEMKIHPVLIFDEEKALLIDSGMPGQFEALRAEIEKYTDMKKLKGVVITHHDIDHVGTAKAFKELLGDDFKIYSNDVEADYISGEKRPHKLGALEANEENLDEETRGRLEFFKKGFESSFVKVDETFKAGDKLPIFNDIDTLDMTGHTIGHMCIYLKDKKALITGDAIMQEEGKLVRTRDRSNYNPEQAIESLNALNDLDIERVLCYHGGEYVGKVNLEELKK